MSKMQREKGKRLIGKQFGKWLIIGLAEDNNFVVGKCECGNIKQVAVNHLLEGKTNSCGCNVIRHGMYKTRLYRIWANMKYRCNCPTSDHYELYGQRGIIVCDDWSIDFLNFYNWAINNGYKKCLTIDRINVNGNYEPSNCRWADAITQNNNARFNKTISYKGETKTLMQWANTLKMSYTALAKRLNEYGWSIEKALNTPIRKKAQHIG